MYAKFLHCCLWLNNIQEYLFCYCVMCAIILFIHVSHEQFFNKASLAKIQSELECQKSFCWGLGSPKICHKCVFQRYVLYQSVCQKGTFTLYTV